MSAYWWSQNMNKGSSLFPYPFSKSNQDPNKVSHFPEMENKTRWLDTGLIYSRSKSKRNVIDFKTKIKRQTIGKIRWWFLIWPGCFHLQSANDFWLRSLKKSIRKCRMLQTLNLKIYLERETRQSNESRWIGQNRCSTALFHAAERTDLIINASRVISW